MKYPRALGLLACGIAFGIASCAKQPEATQPAAKPADPAKPAAAVSKPAAAPEKPAPVAGPRDPATPLKAGDEVTTYALGKLDWIQGSAPATWETGKVYIFECWAMWCGPCVAAIPHVNDLHKKFESKGLRVFGINVWEDGKDKVAEFVAKKGEGMAYPVAYTGKGGVFETEWLKPAGVRGIPHAFVVRNGKFLFSTHPMQLTDELIGKLLESDAVAEAAAAEIAAKNAIGDKMNNAARAFSEAARAKDIPAMEKALAEIKPLDPSGRNTSVFAFELAVAKKDWPEVEKLLAGPTDMSTALSRSAAKILAAPDAPAAVLGATADGVEKLGGPDGNPIQLRMLAGLRWKQGKKDDALTIAKKAVESARQPKYNNRIAAAPFEKFLAALEAGNLPGEEEFLSWMRESRPAPSGPAKPAN